MLHCYMHCGEVRVAASDDQWEPPSVPGLWRLREAVHSQTFPLPVQGCGAPPPALPPAPLTAHVARLPSVWQETTAQNNLH